MSAKYYLAAAAIAAAAIAAGCARTHTVVVYSTNNVKGYFWARPSPVFGGKEGGGFAVLANLLRSETKPKLVLMGGDWSYGSPEGMLTKGEGAVELMNAAGYTAAVPGAGEFAFGIRQFGEAVSKAKFPVLCANIYDAKKGTRPDFCRASAVVEAGGVKIGIIGLVSASLGHSLPREKGLSLRIKNPVEEAKRETAELLKKDVKFIIALTHIGIKEGAPDGDDDRALAAAVPEIGLIISGRNGMELDRPLQAANTYIVQAGSRLLYAGRMELDISSYSGKILRFRYKLVPLEKNRYGQDPRLARVAEEVRARVAKPLSRTVGRAAAAIPNSGWPDSQLANWTADCLRRWGKADVGMMPVNLVDGEIEEGPVAERKLYEIYPPDDRVMFLKIRGADLRQALEETLSAPDRRVFIGGAKITYSPSAPAGSRIKDINIGGDKLLDSKTYHVSAPDRMVSGEGSSSSLVHAIEFANTREPVRKVLGWCMWRERAIRPPEGGRWLAR